MKQKTYSILIVDDNDGVRATISRMMMGQGYAVHEAKSGLEGLVTVATKSIDLVLLDFNMPGLSGLDVLSNLREKHSKLSLPVILVTGRKDDEDVLAALQLGANDYVTKPVIEPIFKARVATQLSMKTESDTRQQSDDVRTDIGAIVPGCVLRSRYQIIRQISRGGFGDIFEAKQSSTGQKVAIKTIRHNRSETDIKQAVPRFETELRVLAKASNPHIVRLIDSDRLANGNLYLVLEFIDGETIRSYIQKRTRLHFHEATNIMRQVLDGLHCAHTLGVVHSDLTSSNIMVSTHGLIPNAHILDFGVVQLSGNSDVTQAVDLNDAALIVGTPQYMAPEQLAENERTASSDLFSWGLVFAECLLGHPLIPHQGPLPVHEYYRSRTKPLSAGFFTHSAIDQFFAHIINLRADNRPRNAGQVLAQLDELSKKISPNASAKDYVNLTTSRAFLEKSNAHMEFGETIIQDR